MVRHIFQASLPGVDIYTLTQSNITSIKFLIKHQIFKRLHYSNKQIRGRDEKTPIIKNISKLKI